MHIAVTSDVQKLMCLNFICHDNGVLTWLKHHAIVKFVWWKLYGFFLYTVCENIIFRLQHCLCVHSTISPVFYCVAGANLITMIRGGSFSGYCPKLYKALAPRIGNLRKTSLFITTCLEEWSAIPLLRDTASTLRGSLRSYWTFPLQPSNKQPLVRKYRLKCYALDMRASITQVRAFPGHDKWPLPTNAVKSSRKLRL